MSSERSLKGLKFMLELVKWEKKIPGLDDKVKELDFLVRENVKSMKTKKETC